MPKRKRTDMKSQALRSRGSLNRHPERVTDEIFSSNDFFDARDLVQVKYEMVRRVGVEGQPVSRTAASFGFSRPSFYKAKAVFEQGGLPALIPKRPGPRGGRKLTKEVVDFLEEVVREEGKLRLVELAGLIRERFGLSVHPRSIERALRRRREKKRR